MKLEHRIREAIDRITSGHGCMRIPAEETDPDLVLADCLKAIKRPQWLLIESAPKDGTEIIGFSPAVGKPLLIRWVAPQDFMTTDECERYMDGVEEADADDAEAWLENPDWACADFRSGDFLADDCQPTHWQPLPAPPEVPMGASE